LDSDDALRNYNQAELAAFDGVAWRLNHLQWMQGAAEMMNFCAFDGERLIGNTSTWRITDERSATENIFVTPDWQKKGVARSMIYTALAHLKQQGKTVASLGTSGTNAKAIRLYTELGYELMGFQLLFGRVIEGEVERHDKMEV
jgi:ribosomal protein S18 acetylase RimI-like enzyme